MLFVSRRATTTPASRGAARAERQIVTVYIDPPIWPGHGHLWSHLISDQSYEELHGFAARIGIPRRGFERDHYDVIAERYGAAVAEGAQPVSSREIVALLTASGLRRRRQSRLARP
jgi:Protein of unknown function (DUF4031)